MNYKIIDSVWWTPSCGEMIGAVVILTTEDKHKCYIGNGKGWNQPVDEQVIAGNGAKVDSRVAKALFPHIDNFID